MSHKHAEVLKAIADEISVQWYCDTRQDWIKLDFCHIGKSNPLAQPEFKWRVTPADQWQADLRQAVRAGKYVEYRVRYSDGSFGQFGPSNLNEFPDSHCLNGYEPDQYRVLDEAPNVTRFMFLSPEMGNAKNCFGMNAKVTFPPTGHDILDLEILK